LYQITVALYPMYTVMASGRYVCDFGKLGVCAPFGIMTVTFFSNGPTDEEVLVELVGATVG